jgi:CubicO group peptidase (beta-lactamase class C family)
MPTSRESGQWFGGSIRRRGCIAGYGYQGWLDQPDGVPYDTYAALGHDGQFIHVIPSLDLVVVRSGTYVKDPGNPIADPNLFGRHQSLGPLGRGRKHRSHFTNFPVQCWTG